MKAVREEHELNSLYYEISIAKQIRFVRSGAKDMIHHWGSFRLNQTAKPTTY